MVAAARSDARNEVRGASAGEGSSARRVAVIGGGIVGLSCAWFLQEEGAEVVLFERDDVGAGASWGNAGYISPTLAVPLPEPSILRYGVGALFDPRSPLTVPVRPEPELYAFLARFARHCTRRHWQRGMAAYRPLNETAQAAYQSLTEGGAEAKVAPAPITASFRDEVEAQGLLTELRSVLGAGQGLDVEMLTGEQARAAEPLLAPETRLSVRLVGQGFIDPPAFLDALAASVRSRGGAVHVGTAVREVYSAKDRVVVDLGESAFETVDAVVLAAGTWLPALARPHGVRTQTQAGRGYSFTVPTETPPSGPLYFPAQRMACTPYREGLRVTGLMEFDTAQAPRNPRRLANLRRSARQVLRGLDWDAIRDEWVGPRPVTPDGLPLIGATRSPGIYVAGGHGMWGVTLGPVTGQLLARQIRTGVTPPELEPFDPCR